MWIMYWKTLFKAHIPEDLDKMAAAISQNMKKDGGQIRVVGQMARSSKNNCFLLVEKVKVPVLLIVGSKDPDFADPQLEMKQVAEALKNSARVDVKMIDGVGHYPVGAASCLGGINGWLIFALNKNSMSKCPTWLRKISSHNLRLEGFELDNLETVFVYM
jgi:hypothetical protein